MSFITKRERVFNEYDLFELPARNEGKLKAYASCTDARAWSHFCSDKTEHLVEIIKRNNEKCRTKYIPTDVIVDTLMSAKNSEIARLKHKIEEFEQMLAAYDQLELTCDQKCEIANAHAAIKAANKELDELCLDLDLSGFTEGMDSDAFETGKSRGDEPTRYRGDQIIIAKGSESAKSRGGDWNLEKDTTRMETKSNQTGMSCRCDVSTSAHDPRIQEMQDTIISKDAKLCAMQNTIAVMENDVCEPYCIYAHIYTALEKIFGVLCQNDKYKLYLSLMTAGKDTRCIDIKGKILFKLKVLEKFSLALIAPCSHEMRDSSQDCACLRAEIVARLDFPSSPADAKKPTLDNKRAHLVADIMENDEMKELLYKDSEPEKHEEDLTEDGYGFDTYSIDTENLKRLKNLQENYDDLMTCYEKVKYEKDNLLSRCHKYEELEQEFDNLKGQLREYNVLWTEREHYRKRSMDIDSLKEQYLVLADETSSLETQLKAESEINHVKSITIEDLRNENLALEKKINDAVIAFEKEKNTLQCKLKETECTVMCQDQQIKSLSIQIDRLLEQNQGNMEQHEDPSQSLILIDEIESLKEQIKNLKDALFCSEEEKQHLQDEFQDQLKIINELKMEIEDWKSTFEKTVQRNEYLEKYTDNFRDEVNRLIEENRHLSQEVEDKSTAVENLINVINIKSYEVKKLSEEMEQKDNEQKILYNQVQELREMYHHNISAVEDEKNKAIEKLQLARQESEELLARVKDCNAVVQQNDEKTIKISMEHSKSPHSLSQRVSLLQEIQSLRDVNSSTCAQISNLQDQKNEYKTSLELKRKESETLENKLVELQHLTHETDTLKEAFENLNTDKEKLENDLRNKKHELEKALQFLQLCKKESEELVNKLDQAQVWEEELINLNKAHKEIMNEKRILQSELTDERKKFENLLQSLNDKNDMLLSTTRKVSALENELIDLKKAYDELISEKSILQNDFDEKTENLNNLYNNLEEKIEENKALLEQIRGLEICQKTTNSNLVALQNENLATQNTLNAIQKESAALIDKLKQFESLESEYEKLKFQNECIQKELNHQMTLFKEIQQDNQNLSTQNQNWQAINEDLERSLINTRNQLMERSGTPTVTYEDILKEVEEMKKEKLRNHNKIKDLHNRLDESDNIISNLSEDIAARDDKVAILENHINHLEDEIRKLHENLADAIYSGESIKDSSNTHLDDTLKSMEAHHSKAAHNMKMDMAKLQNEYAKLENQLSVTKLKTAESSRDKNKYLSQAVHLQNEREVIVADIKQLELKSVGDTSLSPDQCSVEDILASLDRIRKSIEAKSSKSSCLEQSLLKVQTSSQLLLTKADEAKKLVEKEKQKIILEKEEAIRDRHNMEKKVEELKNKLENQITSDSKTIKDLEANILNQKLLNEHNISRLKEELRGLHTSYLNSTAAINSLEEKIRHLAEENEKYLKINDKLNTDLDDEIKLKEDLQNKLEDVCNKSVRNTGTQYSQQIHNKNIWTQTDLIQAPDYDKPWPLQEPDIANVKENNKYDKQNADTKSHTNIMQISTPTENKQVSMLLPKHNPHSVNEVQILTANIEPTFDFVRSSYLNYKIQRLSPGRLEQYSISNIDVTDKSQTQTTSTKLLNFIDDNAADTNLIDIYNRSIHSISSKVIENEADNVVSIVDPQSPGKSSAFTAFDFSVESDTNNRTRYNDALFIEPASQKSAEADLFVIYKDSESTYGEFNRKIPITTIEQAEMIAENVSSVPTSKGKTYKHSHSKQEKKRHRQENDFYLEEEEFDDDSVKPKLNINLPRVENDSPSIVATSEGDKKSLDSYTIGIYPSPKQSSFSDIKINRDLERRTVKQGTPSLPTISNEESYYLALQNSHELNSNENINIIRDLNYKLRNISNQEKTTKGQQNKIFDKNTSKLSEDNHISDASHHKLSRVGADVYLIRSRSNVQGADQQENIDRNTKPRNFALDYILDSVQREVNPNNTFNIINDLRKSKSDESFPLGPTIMATVTSKHSPQKVSSLEYKTISSPSHSFTKISDKTNSKSVVERSIMVKTEETTDYETKIKKLTKALENTEKDYKKKLDAIKVQYDMNIKNILTEHNHGVKNIQGLHEQTLNDVIKIHENEIENLRTMSIEANRKAEKLEKENRTLKNKIQDYSSTTGIDEEPTKISPDTRRRRRSRADTKTLTKTTVEALNLKPKIRSHGPCTCSLDTNLSDTIRNIFEQVDVDQRKMAEHTYVKYIANKILNGNVEALDAQELSFLHLKVCRTWKTKLSKEEALQKRIDSLESELLHKQRHAQEHIAELDRKVAEERRRLQEVREAVCRGTPVASRNPSPHAEERHTSPPPPPPLIVEKDQSCGCNTIACNGAIGERRSAGDLAPGASAAPACVQKPKRTRAESHRAISAKIDAEERREKKLYSDETPTRLRRSHDRSGMRFHKK